MPGGASAVLRYVLSVTDQGGWLVRSIGGGPLLTRLEERDLARRKDAGAKTKGQRATARDQNVTTTVNKSGTYA